MTEQSASTGSPALPGLPPGEEPVIALREVAKWYGEVVAVSDLSFGIGSGVTALLGPNGSGKSTTLNLISGLLAPSSGSIQVFGQAMRGNPGIYKRMGLVSEHEQLYGMLTGHEFVRMNAILQRVPSVESATARAIATVDMTSAAERSVGGYSKGMRQRIKVAAALVHDPPVLLLDEPLNGADPVQRASLIALIRRLGEEGKTVVVSSHVLSEVERFARNVLVIVNGKLAAAGDFRTIRDRMDDRDHVVRIRCDAPRRLAAALVSQAVTTSVRLDGSDRLVAETGDVRAFSRLLTEVARSAGIRLFEVQPVDESLASVFAYLVEK
ncbi:MAG: ABC transporter ATP-binding protein [Thermomicrobiales bacterium]